jgi:hypothetical protein
MGVGGRGARSWRTRHSSAGRRGAEEARALAGEVTGGGGRGARRWWGGVRRSRKRCSPVGEAWGGGGRGAMSDSVRSSGAGSGVAGSIRQCEVRRVARGRTSGMGRARAWGRSIGRVRFCWNLGSR